uniref:Late embryogenesis abundant protein LEA-2 subgroup domain-containing protein n=1 Tax=Oryza brachyantha TaxID=4533 RepID=J3NBJ8_ORYBR
MAGGGPGRGTCCCSSLCSFVIGAGFSVLIYWATFQPRRIRAAVDSATLSNLTVVVPGRNNGSGGVVSYRLDVNVNLYNPSGRAGIYYDGLDARLILARDGAGAEIKADGEVGFELELDARVRYKLGFVPIRTKPKVRCTVRIPVKRERGRRGGVDSLLSSGDKCTVKY